MVAVKTIAYSKHILKASYCMHLVPYVENRKETFLKTVIPSRKATKQYLGKKS